MNELLLKTRARQQLETFGQPYYSSAGQSGLGRCCADVNPYYSSGSGHAGIWEIILVEMQFKLALAVSILI